MAIPLGGWALGVPGKVYQNAQDQKKEGTDLMSELGGVQRPQDLQWSGAEWDKMRERQNLMSSQAKDQSYRQQAQSSGDIWNQLAQRRGLTGGAAERGARSASLQGMVGRQGIGMQNQQNLMGIDIANEQARKAFEMEQYKAKMQAYAAAQQAKAQYQARPRGLFGGEGFLGLF